MNKRKINICIATLLLIIGIYFIIIAIFPTTVEITPENNSITATVTKRNLKTFLKKETRKLDNVTHCSIKEIEKRITPDFERPPDFCVVIISPKQHKALPVKQYDNPKDANILKENLNKAILNKTEYQHSIFSYHASFLGCVFIIISFILFYSGKNISEKTENKAVLKTKEDKFKEIKDKEKIHNKMNRTERKYITIMVLFFASLFFSIAGILPTATIVEIKNNNENITALVSVRNIDTFFKRKTKIIEHVKYCSIHKEEHQIRNSKTYSFNVIIFSSNEKDALLVQKYNNSYDAKEIQDKINDAIFNKKDVKYTIRYYEYFFIAIVLFLAYFMLFLGGRNGNDYKDKAEKEQIDNINDSIIK